MRKTLALLLCLWGLALVLTACNGNKEPPHEHEFDSTWLYDEAQHWHAATCEHTDLESDRGDHVDADGNDICDVCGYIKDHTHSFEDAWSWNESTHYHKSACGHNVKKDEAKHADANNDAICDVCAYDYDHTHTYEEKWVSVGENGHWHAPSCGHAVDGVELTAHTDANNDGDCDVCGENGGHEHTYSEEWTTTDDEHWREVTCGHDIPVADKGVHADGDGDTDCDICGYIPPHFHTFEKTLSSDGSNHWYAPTCGHDVKKDEAPHNGYEADGVCDDCSFIVFRLFTVTVTVPEYVTVYAPDGAETTSFTVKENTPVSFKVSVPTFAEIVGISGAKQEGKPVLEGDRYVYTVLLDGLIADSVVTLIGNKLSIVEVIVDNADDSLNIENLWKYTLGEVTFHAPSAGRYMIFSTTNEYVQFNAGAVDEEGKALFTKICIIDVTEPGDYTVQTRFFAMNTTDLGLLEFKYSVAKFETEITLSSLRAEGYTLPTNVDVTVYFTAPKAGKYQISSSTLGLIWNDVVQDSIIVTATEDGQLMSFTVRYEKTTAVSYVFDCDIVSLAATPLQEGENTVVAPNGAYQALSVTADKAGTYMIQTTNSYIRFFMWNESTDTLNGLGTSYAKDLAAGESMTIYVSVNVYEYDGVDDITATVSVSYLGHVPSGSGVCNAQVGVMNGYISDYVASDFVLTVQNGDLISLDGENWETSVQVSVPDNGFILYWVKSASESDTVQVSIERIAYEFTLNVGTQVQNMIPGMEYTVFLHGSSDDAHYVTYLLEWNDPELSVSFGGNAVTSGGSIEQYNEYYNLVMVYNGDSAADVQFVLTDPYVAEDGGDGETSETTTTLSVGANTVYVSVSNYFCAGTTVSFTAEQAGTYVLSVADGETNADVVIADDYVSESIAMPYTFTLEAGETVEFTVFTTANMTLTEDYIDLVITAN